MQEIYRKCRVQHIRIILFSGLFITCFWSCEKITLTDNPLPAGDSIKFSRDILPIFNACTGCHNGSQALDLAHNPYQNLIEGKYINVADPAQSKLYIQLTTVSSHIPRTSPDQKQTILQWIKQG